MSKPLSKKISKIRERFAEEYLIDLNATQAALRAGYKRSPAQNGFKALQDPAVQELIQQNMDERSERARINADGVLTEISHSAFSNVQDLFDEHGRLLPVHTLPRAVAAAISSIEVVTKRAPNGEPGEVEYTSKIKLWDKTKSLDQLGKHLKLFTDRCEITGKDGGPIQTTSKVLQVFGVSPTDTDS